MLIIDFANLSLKKVNLSLTQVGITNLNDSILTLLKKLKLDSIKIARENFTLFHKFKKVNIQPTIQKLKTSRKIIEVIGSFNFQKEMPVCFSTFVSLQPKNYLKNYIDVGKILCNENKGLYFTVWLEDRLSMLKNNWDSITINKALNKYCDILKKEVPSVKFLKSSEIAPDGIPRGFAEEKFSSVKVMDFLSIMPFHLRHPNLITIFDVVHFAWNCYIIDRYPAIYLSGINTKFHFQFFRKILGKNITIILLPLGSENLLTRF